MMTESPPAGDPVPGETRFSFGAVDGGGIGGEKVKAVGSVAVFAPLTTVTPVVAGTCGGVFAVIVVLVTNLTLLAAAKPKLTTALPETKLVPVIVTGVPPLDGPEVGVMEVTVAPLPGAVPAVVNDQTDGELAVAVRLAIVLETTFQ